ncbi:ABC transporter permease [Cesiribacter sp. SM1]|uniref:ABC transporter permease n=1 Tax=Cesiribacter sp. SM1 TaxID=2861196 RepID=UPI001CD493B2|nr:ABC transporter permease [Cesiribacter sp. SM1]
MFRQYLKIAIRNIRKNKGFSLINIIGLSLGLASMMTLLLLVQQYYTTDSFHKDSDNLYYLKTFSANGESYDQTTFPLLYEIQKSCPEVVAATHWQRWNDLWLQHNSIEVQERTQYVDSGFFKVFSFPLKEGNAQQALADKYSVVISQNVATQLFGNEKALGKTIMAADTIPLTVTGVLDAMPVNSSLRAEVLLPLQLLQDTDDFKQGADWYNTFAINYLRLREGADPKLLDQKIDRLVKQFYADEAKQSMVKTVPFSQLKSEGDPLIGSIIAGALASAVFIVLVMIANLLNLNTAIVFSRTKEVAVRRIIGSGKRSIVYQFCLENALLVFTSLLLGFYLFLQLLLPQVNVVMSSGFGELQFQWQQDYVLLALFVLIAALIVLVAGSIPAWYLTSVKVSEAVKGKFIKADSRGWLRNIFITVQFTMAVVLIGVAIVLNSQIRYMKAASLGFNTTEVAVVNLDLSFRDPAQAESRFETILNSLRSNPYVKSVSTTPVIPTNYWQNYNTYIDVETGREILLRHVPADAGFAETYQIPVVEGRNFNDALAAGEEGSIIINRSAAEAFGWANPIGKQIKGKGGDEVGTVIGVLDDFHYSNLQQAIEPLLHWYNGKPALGFNRYLSIRLDTDHRQEIMAGLEQDFKTMPARRSFSHTPMDELVEGQYSLMEGLLKVTNYVALLTVFIAAMGLFGLVALFARQRIKEIGVRKVLGATVLDITALLSKDFLRLVMLAIIIATPIAWYAMHRWLEDFAYRINISWWYFLSAGLLALFIALATVSVQAVKAAKANPVKNLRTE